MQGKYNPKNRHNAGGGQLKWILKGIVVMETLRKKRHLPGKPTEPPCSLISLPITPFEKSGK